MSVVPYEALYTVKEAAKLLKVNPNQVYAYMKSGQLVYVVLGSKKIRGKDLEACINGYPVSKGRREEDESEQEVQEPDC